MDLQNIPSKEVKSFAYIVESLQKRADEFKRQEEQFKAFKQTRTKMINDFFIKHKIDKNMKFDSTKNGVVESYGISKVERVDINFDADKLEKALPPDLVKDVIKKEYSIIDYEGLVGYLKECGVSPKKFKEFISVSKTVDQIELDQAENLGRVNYRMLDGTYTISKSTPYFRINHKIEDGEQ